MSQFKIYDIINVGENMKSSYIIDYINENEFRKKERAIKKYNMLAYKKLLFDYYPSLREGNFLGVLVSTNEKDHIDKYELTLPTELTTYKGVMVSKSHKELDMFKINLLNSMNKNGFFILNLPDWLISIITIIIFTAVGSVIAKLIIK